MFVTKEMSKKRIKAQRFLLLLKVVRKALYILAPDAPCIVGIDLFNFLGFAQHHCE